MIHQHGIDLPLLVSSKKCGDRRSSFQPNPEGSPDITLDVWVMKSQDVARTDKFVQPLVARDPDAQSRVRATPSDAQRLLRVHSEICSIAPITRS